MIIQTGMRTDIPAFYPEWLCNIVYVETKENRMYTEFCGSTLFREQPEKNARFAPKHYVDGAKGKFMPHR